MVGIPKYDRVVIGPTAIVQGVSQTPYATTTPTYVEHSLIRSEQRTLVIGENSHGIRQAIPGSVEALNVSQIIRHVAGRRVCRDLIRPEVIPANIDSTLRSSLIGIGHVSGSTGVDRLSATRLSEGVRIIEYEQIDRVDRTISLSYVGRSSHIHRGGTGNQGLGGSNRLRKVNLFHVVRATMH